MIRFLMACATLLAVTGIATNLSAVAPSTQPATTKPATVRTISNLLDCADVARAARRAREFLVELAPQMDPVKLRTEHRMKGKKFYVEYLNAWNDLYQCGDVDERKAIHSFLAPIVERTRKEPYHNLTASSDLEFKQDIISYLSACVLHDQLGFDTGEYREHIRRIVPRTLSPKHLSTRGVDNTMGIVYRLRQLGYDAGITFCELWKRPGCVTREHPDLTRLDLRSSRQWMPVYDLTHEVFYLTEFGSTPMQCVSGRDLDYIRRMHAALIPIFMRHTNVDMVSELIMDLNYLGITDLPEYQLGRRFILERQNEDGSWGDPAHVARHVKLNFSSNPAYLPKVGQHLHTTGVTLNALLYPCFRGMHATRGAGISRPGSNPATLPVSDDRIHWPSPGADRRRDGTR